jgi:hypothetical protein
LLKPDDISSVKQGQRKSCPLSYFRSSPHPLPPPGVAVVVVSVAAAVVDVTLATSKAGAGCRSIRRIVFVKVSNLLRRNSNQHLLLSF